MLFAEKAKFRSAFERINNQTTKDIQQKINPSQIRGRVINFKIKEAIFRALVRFVSREFIEVFNKSWFIVSKRLARDIKNRIKNIFSFIPG